MNFDIVDDIGEIETIARGSGIREIERLRKVYGIGPLLFIDINNYFC